MIKQPDLKPTSKAVTRGRPPSGFTLIEMLVTVATLAIIVAIAYPAYQDFGERARRAVGKHTLMDVASRQEQFFTDNKQYAVTLPQLGYTTTTPFFINDRGTYEGTASDRIYQITLGNTGATTYTATAAPVGIQTSDSACDTLTVNELGVKGASGSAGANKCW